MRDEGRQSRRFFFRPPPSALIPFGNVQPHGDEQSGAGDGRERNAVNAQHRRVSRERAQRNLGIADREPREPGEQPSSRPLKCGPYRRKQQRQPEDDGQTGRCKQIAGECWKQREIDAKQQGRRGSKRRRHGAEVVKADVHPGDTTQKQAQPECKSENSGTARQCMPGPQPHQQRKREYREREQGKRRKPRYRERAEEKSQEDGVSEG